MSRAVVQLCLGDAESLIVVDDVQLSPEVLRDLSARVREGLQEAVALYMQHGVMPGEEVYDDSVETLNDILGEFNADTE